MTEHFGDLSDDCIKTIGDKLCVDDLLPLSLVNKRLKQLFFNRFDNLPTKPHKLMFRQHMLSLKIQDKLINNDCCNVYIGPRFGKNAIIMDYIFNLIPNSTVLIVSGDKYFNCWANYPNSLIYRDNEVLSPNWFEKYRIIITSRYRAKKIKGIPDYLIQDCVGKSVYVNFKPSKLINITSVSPIIDQIRYTRQ